MINLLPPEAKQNFVYARRNTHLLRWAAILLASIGGIGVIVLGGLFYMQQSIHEYSVQKSKSQAELDAQHLDQTQAQVESIANSLKLVVQVLSREVLFSKLIQQIGTVIPANANLTDLKISQVQGGIDLTAITTDYATASQVQVNLSDPANKIFDRADIVNITCGGANVNSHYPCTVTIRAQFAKSNPYLFISNSKAKP